MLPLIVLLTVAVGGRERKGHDYFLKTRQEPFDSKRKRAAGCGCPAMDARPAAAYLFFASASIAFHSFASSLSEAAAMFSSTHLTDEVPGDVLFDR